MVSRLIDGLVAGLWRLVSRAPRTIIGTGLILAALSALASVLFLKLDSDQDKLVSPKVPYQQRYLEALENFGDQEYIYVVIEAEPTPDGRRRAETFAEALAARLRAHPEHVEALYYRMTADDLGPGALYYASLEEAAELGNMVAALGPQGNAWLQNGSLVELVDRMAGLLAGGGEGDGFDPRMLAPALDGLESLLGGIDGILMGQTLSGPVFDLRDQSRHYFFTGDQRLLIMRILPAKDYGTMDVIAAPLAAIREALAETQAEFPQVKSGLTGRPVLQADEMATTNRDMTRASLISAALVGVLFMVVLHGWLRPVLVICAQAMAIAWTFGFTTATLGVLNLLSIVFVLVLIGIGVDFGVHVVMRYVECRHAGHSVEDAVRIALIHTGPGVILGAVTSVCAFYAVVGSDFTGLAQLGLIGGTGILLCLAAMLTILPALLLLTGGRSLTPKTPPRMVALPFMGRLTAHPKRLLGIMGLVTLLLLPGLPRVRFSYNLLELQASGLESVEYEKLLIAASDESTWYAIAMAEDLAEEQELQKRFAALPTVGHVESLSDYLPDAQQRKAELFAVAAAALGSEPAANSLSDSVDGVALGAALTRLGGALDSLVEKLFAAGAGAETARVDALLNAIDSARAQLSEEPQRARRLVPFQAQVQQDIRVALRQLRTWLTAAPVTFDTMPEGLRNLFVGRDGRIQVKIVPREDIWQFEKLTRFVTEMRQVDDGVTGVPISVYESAQLMRRTFLSAAVLTLLLVSLLLWLSSRSIRYVLLALLPLSVGLIWLLSLMGWLGLSFNLANFFAIPILIAIGVDGGVHLQERWNTMSSGSLFDTSTPMAVTLSFATTMIGFGGLLLAHHRGLASLGGVMVLGSLTCMLSCILVLPAVLKLVLPQGGAMEE